MASLIGLVLLLLLLVTVGCAIWAVNRAQTAGQARRDREEWEATDRELRELEYAALYERYVEPWPPYMCGTASPVTCSTMPQAAFWTTHTMHSSAMMYPGRASGRPWNDIPPEVVLAELPEEVPGAD